MILLIVCLVAAAVIGLTAGIAVEWFLHRGWKQELLMKRSRAFPLITLQVLMEAKMIVDASNIPLTLGEIETEILFRKEEWVKDQIRALWFS